MNYAFVVHPADDFFIQKMCSAKYVPIIIDSSDLFLIQPVGSSVTFPFSSILPFSSSVQPILSQHKSHDLSLFPQVLASRPIHRFFSHSASWFLHTQSHFYLILPIFSSFNQFVPL